MQKIITANGYEFNYIEAGEGVPLVFVHGSVLDYRYWTREIEYYAKQFHTMSLSRRHHWPAVPQGNFHYSAIAQAEDLMAVLEKLNVGPVHLVGHSYGGYIATRVACDRPDLLLSATLVEPGGPIEGQNRGVSRNAEYSRGADLIAAGDTSGGVAHFLDNVCAARKWKDSSAEFQSMTLNNAITLTQQMQEIRPVMTAAELTQVDLPVLLVLGELSHSPFPETLNRLHELLPTADKALIPKASHMVNMDNFNAFAEALSDFLAKL